ncbi:DUF6069 family protein [Nocardia camponoti]|uniref:Uncharacterized protein n=1 Tax=Nocardia camponoti TaxID=1616106 RepID=A0A917QMM0_9NOCA|nr:DUF6069 family protein [Nocardia camponoti]GGK58814.1 hypothetical protein GCM10011591_33780 [Nocardia camponoti]
MTTNTVAANRLSIPALSRPVAVIGAALAALVLNLILWGIGEAAGGSFLTTDKGVQQSVAPGGVVLMSLAPLGIGLTVAVLISYLWTPILRVAAVVGSVLSLGTIALTVAADFDTASTIALSLMHVALVPVMVIALEAVRKNIS